MIFAKPSTEQEAVNLLNEAKGITRILGGGTDVLVQMKSGITEPLLTRSQQALFCQLITLLAKPEPLIQGNGPNTGMPGKEVATSSTSREGK